MMLSANPKNATETVPSYDARTLVGQNGLAQIELDGQTYFLRITRLGKLILTK
ncbi:hemin uptake protein HemP [Aliiroseovarius sp. PTFE2010]|uniref:hemin uptake protein HemP n=1 Tax=Aliiroseovarius sp. PTFE2010 TaxID=3417190 RepID=UPI003CEDCA4D